MQHLPCPCPRCAPRLAECPAVAERAHALATSDDAADRALTARFLAGCAGDECKAAHVLTVSLLWRHDFGVDRLLEDADDSAARLAAVQAYYPMGLLSGRGVHGHPIVVVRLGLSDPSASGRPNCYNDESGEEAWLRAHVWVNERAARVSPERLVIMDLHNLSRVHVTRAALASLQRSVAIDQRHYPGSVSRWYLINAPLLLRTVWSVVTSWLDPLSLEKVKVLGDVSDPSVAAELLEHAPARAGKGARLLHMAARANRGVPRTPERPSYARHARPAAAFRTPLAKSAAASFALLGTRTRTRVLRFGVGDR